MIFLVDCNNFYVSCERLFRPELLLSPVIVLSNNDGCIISRSNEAKQLGLKMGEPVFKAKEIIKNNNVHVFSSNFELYGEISNRIMSQLKIFSNNLEVYSIDEAFLEINSEDYKNIGLNIVKNIKKTTGIPVSVGIAETKTLSKIAGNIAKKSLDNCFLIENNWMAKKILSCTPIKDVWGLGNQYTKFMINNGISTAESFMNMDRNWILNKLNINVLRTRDELHGIKCYKVSSCSKPKKSIRVSRSFRNDIDNYQHLEKYVSDFAFLACKKLRKENKRVKQLQVFILTNRFKQSYDSKYFGTMSYEFFVSTNNYIEIIKHSLILLRNIFKDGLRYKKAGVILNQLSPVDEYQSSFMMNNIKKNNDLLMDKIDYLNDKFGNNKIIFSSQNINEKSKISKKKLSPNYMNSWNNILNLDI